MSLRGRKGKINQEESQLPDDVTRREGAELNGVDRKVLQWVVDGRSARRSGQARSNFQATETLHLSGFLLYDILQQGLRHTPTLSQGRFGGRDTLTVVLIQPNNRVALF